LENSPRTPGSEAIRCPQGELKRGWGGCPSRRVRSEQGERLRASAGKMRILHPTATRRRPSPLTAHCARAVDAVYLDFRKAFDTVCHDILITQLRKCGIDEWSVRGVVNWLTGRAQSAEGRR